MTWHEACVRRGMFEDDLTRELPSSLRTFTDLPPVTSANADAIVELADEDVVAIVEHTVVIPRPAPASIPPLTADVPRAPLPSAWDSPLVLLVGAALLGACGLAGAVGIAAGRTRSAPSSDAQASERQPRVAVVAAAREVITLAPLTAPEKEIGSEPELTPLPARPLRHAARPAASPAHASAASGWGHLGSDRQPSRGTPARP